MLKIRFGFACLALAALPALAGPPTVEVLHFMTSGGQAKAVAELFDAFT